MKTTIRYFSILMRSLIVVLALVLLAAAGFGQKKATIKGKVTDVKTSEALPSVNITIKGTYYGNVTNLNGEFVVSGVNPGTYTIDVSLIGYKTVEYTGVKIEDGETKTLDVKLEETVLSLGQEVVIIGEKPLFDLEETQSSRSVNSAEIKAAAVKSVQDVVSMQTGVVQSDNEIHIRGGRTYENAYLVDGISVQDPLSGTGFGLQLSPDAIQEAEVITGGYNAEYGQATSGIVNITTKEGTKNYAGGLSYKRDHFGFNQNSTSNENSDIYNFSLSGPEPLTTYILPSLGAKLPGDVSFFGTFYANLTDGYTRWTQNIINGQPYGYVLTPEPNLQSSILSTDFFSPRRANAWSWMTKFTWKPNSMTKLSYTYSSSITIDQNTKAIQATLEFVEPTPGYQYIFQNIPDSANTFTQRYIQHAITWTQTLSNKTFYELRFSRYTAHVRGDVNGEFFTQYNEPIDIITFPIQYYNKNRDTIGVIPGDGFYDLGNASTWRDHYMNEYTFKGDLTNNFTEKHKFKTGFEMRFQNMQMVDILDPWYKPLGLNNDIFVVNPAQGAFYAQDNLTIKGMILNFGMRLDYWFPGKYIDQVLSMPSSETNVSPTIRDLYYADTYDIFGQRMKARLSPRLGVSHPVSDNQTLFFSYGHFSKLPRPQFVYEDLVQSGARSVSQTIGNPDLNPETTVSYELGIRNQLSGNDVLTVTAYYKDIFDYITAKTLQNLSSRFSSTYTTYINEDYSRTRGLEIEYKTRFMRWLTAMFSGTYSIATGKSSSADEALYNLQLGLAENIKETPMVFDRPVQLTANFNINTKKDEPLFGFGRGVLDDYNLFIRFFYESGMRYTPQLLEGYDPSNGRPEYYSDPNHPYASVGDPWFYVDLNLEKNIDIGIGKVVLSLEVQNLFNNLNSQIINPVTGRAYQYGDPTQYPSPTVNDPLYPDRTYPVTPYPYDPSRYLTPRTYKLGLAYAF
jgi:outer membrane receptor protein involved in Fe transport